jgi:hypothetical protein
VNLLPGCLSGAPGARDRRQGCRRDDDITARLVARWLSERLGQQFVVENRPDGSNNMGTEAVVRAPADGAAPRQFGRRD